MESSKIAFVRDQDGLFDIFVMDPDGTNQTTLRAPRIGIRTIRIGLPTARASPTVTGAMAKGKFT